MKFQTTAILTGLLAGSALAVSAVPAHAFNFTSGEDLGSCANISYLDGIKSCTTTDGFTLTVTKDGLTAGTDANLGGYLTTKTVNGVTGIGVYGDPSPTHGSLHEIDYGEEITATLAAARVIQSIDLAFLYQPGVFGDKVFEVAEIGIGNGQFGRLTVTGDTTAQWVFNGITTVLTALSPSTEQGGGLYRILNPFGDLLVDTITFNSVQLKGTSYRYSDFSIAGIKAAGVPEPSLMVGLGAVGGLLLASRRRRSA